MTMILQTLLVHIPSEGVIVFAGALGVDFLKIILFAGFGLFTGSLIAFFLGRLGREAVVSKIVGEKWMKIVDSWCERHGWKGVILARLVPIIPFDLISYLSGVTSIKLKTYALATLVGVFPRVFFLALVGSALHEFLHLLEVGIEITFLGGVALLLLLAYLDAKGWIDLTQTKVVGGFIKKFFTS